MDRYKNNGIFIDNNVMISAKYMTSKLTSEIYQACESGLIPFKFTIFKSGDRLDLISGNEYGNGFDWWIIAAASGIGWWLQINDDTVLRIPDRDKIRERFNL
jgi:hypothetical protein